MKKVLLIGSELGKGGAERSISLLSYYLQQYYDVTLCILSGRDREQFYKTGDKVVFIDPPQHTSVVGKIKAWRYRLQKIKELKQQNTIDVSISFLEGPDYINVLTRGREKVVLSIRGSKMHDKVIAGAMGAVRKKLLIPQLYRKADEIVCVTQALADELHQHFGVSQKRLTTIYNFYETEQILAHSNQPLTQAEAAIFTGPVIITSGRLHVAKEHDKLIRLLARIKDKSNARLMILGDGELKAPLMELATQLGLKPCDWQASQDAGADVYFMGFQSNAFKFYRHSTLFALASSWEGFPNVLAEALICQKPVVSTDCPTGPREILNVTNLPADPTTQTHRLPVGSLLPMLLAPSEAVMQQWSDEIIYWLQAAPPDEEDFTALTRRFTLDAMLSQWRQVIDGPKINSH